MKKVCTHYTGYTHRGRPLTKHLDEACPGPFEGEEHESEDLLSDEEATQPYNPFDDPYSNPPSPTLVDMGFGEKSTYHKRLVELIDEEFDYTDRKLEEINAYKKKEGATTVEKGFASALTLKKIAEVSPFPLDFINCYRMEDGTECYTFEGICPIHATAHTSKNRISFKISPKGYSGWKCFKDDSWKFAPL